MARKKVSLETKAPARWVPEVPMGAQENPDTWVKVITEHGECYKRVETARRMVEKGAARYA